MHDGRETKDTFCGACLSIIVFVLLIVYIIELVQVLKDQEQFTTTEAHFPDFATFSGQDGFNVAFAYTDYYGDTGLSLEDKSRAVLKAYLYEWGKEVKEVRTELGEKGEVGRFKTTPLELH